MVIASKGQKYIGLYKRVLLQQGKNISYIKRYHEEHWTIIRIKHVYKEVRAKAWPGYIVYKAISAKTGHGYIVYKEIRDKKEQDACILM